MSRRRRSTPHTIIADPVYGEKLVTKFVNVLMKQGKKGIAQSVFYKAIEQISNRIKDIEAIEIFKDVVEGVRPTLEVRSRRVGGSTYQVPFEVKEHRGTILSIRWIIQAARKRNGKSMIDKLSNEIIDAYNKKGEAYKKRETTHKMAESNRAFSHFVW